MSVQDTVGSEIAFAGVLHLAQTVPSKWLRCLLNTSDMVSVSTASLDTKISDGSIIAPSTPGLGITPDMDLLGAPVAHYS